MDYEAKLTELRTTIAATADMRARSELYALYRNCRIVCDEMSKEEVECRRRKKVTQKYKDLEVQLQERIANFEQWITFSKLLY